MSLVFAELKDPVRRKIDRYGLARAIEPDHFFPTLEAAVTAYRNKTGTTWARAGEAGSAEREDVRHTDDGAPPPDLSARPSGG